MCNIFLTDFQKVFFFLLFMIFGSDLQKTFVFTGFFKYALFSQLFFCFLLLIRSFTNYLKGRKNVLFIISSGCRSFLLLCQPDPYGR
jgi:hypothetical protein